MELARVALIPENDRENAAIRHHRIAEAAYYRAEARGFTEGHELDDWLEAESDIDRTFLAANELTA